MQGHDDSTWGTDETLTVTTHFVEEFDDIYIAIAIITVAFISIPLIAKALKRHGLYIIENEVYSKCLASDKKVSRVIRSIIRFNNGSGFDARLISFLGKFIRFLRKCNFFALDHISPVIGAAFDLLG